MRADMGGRVGGRLRILFLGNAYNPLSVACLEALARMGHEVVVGVYDPTGAGAWKLLRTTLRMRGVGFVARMARRLAQSRVRLALRRLGVPLPGPSSLAELILAKRLRALPCRDPNETEFVDQVQHLEIDLLVVAAF